MNLNLNMDLNVDWEAYRRNDGTIRVYEAFENIMHKNQRAVTAPQADFIQTAERLHPIRSRSLAALAISMALTV